MAYCTADQLNIPDEIVVRLADDDADGAADSGAVDDAIRDGAAVIDAYVSQRAELPLATPYPDILEKLNKDLAVYELYSRVRETIPETRQDRYDNAIKLLESFAKGIVNFGLPVDEDAAASGEASMISTRTKIFDAARMAKY
jgi:phage gp36-like protein